VAAVKYCCVLSVDGLWRLYKLILSFHCVIQAFELVIQVPVGCVADVFPFCFSNSSLLSAILQMETKLLRNVTSAANCYIAPKIRKSWLTEIDYTEKV